MLFTPNLCNRQVLVHFSLLISSCVSIGHILLSELLPACRLELFSLPNTFLRVDWAYSAFRKSSCVAIGIIFLAQYVPACRLGTFWFQNIFLRGDWANAGFRMSFYVMMGYISFKIGGQIVLYLAQIAIIISRNPLLRVLQVFCRNETTLC